MKKNILLCFFSFLLCLTSCLVPVRSFPKTKTPPPPDYSRQSSWASLPAIKDSADALPPIVGAKDGQADAKVDVFFIHPTSYLIGHHWNADVRNKALNRFTDRSTIRGQASVFNESCKIYAPRYRQAEIMAYLDKKGNAQPAFDTAYRDVKNAFIYYLKNYNHGRPIIIASHSQGTDHAVRLLHDFFDHDSILYKQLVACYIIGRPVTPGTFKTIVPCDSAGQTGCFVSWNTLRWGREKLFSEKQPQLECTNPLSWRRDTLYVPASANKGSVRFTFKTVDKGIADAKCTPGGLLWVHAPRHRGYARSKSYHLYDYNFFYVSIRENVKDRINAYFRNQNRKNQQGASSK
ncbi:MAG TPA: DUF3089 domain-containing protein [Bacteroidia bacterium]|nr:DUF3089 domain-containing protein [Bacteroidia bacterium]